VFRFRGAGGSCSWA